MFFIPFYKSLGDSLTPICGRAVCKGMFAGVIHAFLILLLHPAYS